MTTMGKSFPPRVTPARRAAIVRALAEAKTVADVRRVMGVSTACVYKWASSSMGRDARAIAEGNQRVRQNKFLRRARRLDVARLRKGVERLAEQPWILRYKSVPRG